MSKLKTNHITLKAKCTLDILSDICAICRENVLDKCIKCSNSNNQCISVLGECNHGYHLCCINNWTSSIAYTSHNCPMCNQRWNIKRRSSNCDNKKYNYNKKKPLYIDTNIVDEIELDESEENH